MVWQWMQQPNSKLVHKPLILVLYSFYIWLLVVPIPLHMPVKRILEFRSSGTLQVMSSCGGSLTCNLFWIKKWPPYFSCHFARMFFLFLLAICLLMEHLSALHAWTGNSYYWRFNQPQVLTPFVFPFLSSLSLLGPFSSFHFSFFENQEDIPWKKNRGNN